MYLAVTGCIEPRAVVKALIEISDRLEPLKAVFEATPLKQTCFKGIMLSFCDEPESYFNEVLNGDRIFQMECGYNHFTPHEHLQAMLLEVVAKRVCDATDRCPIGQEDKRRLLAVVRDWRESLGI